MISNNAVKKSLYMFLNKPIKILYYLIILYKENMLYE